MVCNFQTGGTGQTLITSTNSTNGDNFFNINDTVQLTCTIDTDDVASYTVHWRHGQMDVRSSQFITVEMSDAPVNVTATFKLDDIETAGYYVCIAVVVDDSNNPDITSNQTVNVRPFFTALPDSTIVLTSNSNPNLTCTADGFPIARVQLYRIVNNQMSLLAEGDGEVAVFNRTLQYADAGEYRCIAMSLLLDNSHTIQHDFTVLCKYSQNFHFMCYMILFCCYS